MAGSTHTRIIQKSNWHCKMCGISLDEAVTKHNDPLKMDIDDYLDDKLDNSYIYERTQKKNPKQTCGKACGYNYSSWLRTQEPKKSYTNKIFKCYLCHKTSEGGRVIIANKTKVNICRSCARKKTTNHLRHIWSALNKGHRLDYQRQYYTDHKKRLQKYKRAWRAKRKKAGLPS